MKRKKKDDDLDMQTSFADMNVDGFKWYNPSAKKKPDGKVRHSISRKEYWQMVRGAFAAILPYFAIFLLAMGITIALVYLWLS